MCCARSLFTACPACRDRSLLYASSSQAMQRTPPWQLARQLKGGSSHAVSVKPLFQLHVTCPDPSGSGGRKEGRRRQRKRRAAEHSFMAMPDRPRLSNFSSENGRAAGRSIVILSAYKFLSLRFHYLVAIKLSITPRTY